MSRYSPYAQDPVVIRLAEGVRDAFATKDARFPGGAVHFFRPEQKALGKMVMSRTEGEHGIELETISSYKFKERLASPALADSPSVQQSLAALRDVEDVETLPGRKRLEKAQHHLVELLGYIEHREGYTLFAGERKKCSGQREGSALNSSRRVPTDGSGRPNREARPPRTMATPRSRRQ